MNSVNWSTYANKITKYDPVNWHRRHSQLKPLESHACLKDPHQKRSLTLLVTLSSSDRYTSLSQTSVSCHGGGLNQGTEPQLPLGCYQLFCCSCLQISNSSLCRSTWNLLLLFSHNTSSCWKAYITSLSNQTVSCTSYSNFLVYNCTVSAFNAAAKKLLCKLCRLVELSESSLVAVVQSCVDRQNLIAGLLEMLGQLDDYETLRRAYTS